MATTEHPIVLDLGKVVGKTVYEEWLAQTGNEGKSFEDFLEEIADLGIQIKVVNSVESDNPDAVSSLGVWNKLSELGLLGDKPESAKGNPATEVLTYSLGDDPAPDEIDSASGVSGVWTLSPTAGQEWHVDNAGTAANALAVELPNGADIGSRIRVFFRPDTSIGQCADVTVSAGGILVGGETAPSVIGGVVIDATMGAYGWIVVRHYVAGETTVVIITKSYKIVYSGANRASTAQASYQTVVSWSGEEETIAPQKSASLRTDIFRKLYNVAPFLGWTTRNAPDASVEYTDGETVWRWNGYDLTLYPLYTPTDVAVNLGRTTKQVIRTEAHAADKTEDAGTFTFRPGDYVPGFQSESYAIKIYGRIYSGNNSPSKVEYKVDDGEWATLCQQSGVGQEGSATQMVPFVGTGSHTIKFRAYQHSSSNACTSDYWCYVSAMTIW